MQNLATFFIRKYISFYFFLIDFDRDLKITSEDGELLIKATSKWCVINTETRALQRTDNVNYAGICVKEVNYEDSFGKIVLPNKELVKKFIYTVQFTDLDHNKHMNNTNYANLVINAVNNKEFLHFEINFNSECLLGDDINVCYAQEENGEYVVGINNDKAAFTAYIK